MARTVAPVRAPQETAQLQDIVRALDRNPGRSERWIAEQLVREYGHRRTDADRLVELAADHGLLARGPDGLLDIVDETGKMRDRIAQALNGPPDDSYLDAFFEHAELEVTGDPADVTTARAVKQRHGSWQSDRAKPSYNALAKALVRRGAVRGGTGERSFLGLRKKSPAS